MKDPRQVLIRPVITEKSFKLADEENSYTFEVHQKANKPEIKEAIEAIFGVHVVGVRTATKRGKSRRRRLIVGRERNWKKAVVTLSAEDSLDIY